MFVVKPIYIQIKSQIMYLSIPYDLLVLLKIESSGLDGDGTLP